MDPWLKDDVKELLAKPCLSTASVIGNRMDNRRRMGQEIDERALTEDFVDTFDSSSSLTTWGPTKKLLQDRDIYVNTAVRKSTAEHVTGADVGLILTRNFYGKRLASKARYATLIQCKRVDNTGHIADFYHVVKSSGKTQSSLMLDITPASFYFVYVAPSFVHTYCTIEPLGFVRSAPGCSSPVWNMGCFGFDEPTFSFLSNDEKAAVTSIIVVPAMAVEAQQSKGKAARLNELLPNAVPFWYWFSELFVAGFIGDYRSNVITTAGNCKTGDNAELDRFGVRFSIEVSIGNG